MTTLRRPAHAALVRAAIIIALPLLLGGMAAASAQYGIPAPISGAPPPKAQPAQPTPGETVRPAIATAVNGARELINAQKYQEALAMLQEADKLADLTPFEKYVLDQVRGVAAARAGDGATAIKAFEAVVASGRMNRDDQLRVVEVLAQLNYQAKDYRKAASWALRYIKEGGTDPATRLLHVRSLYLAEDYAAAATEIRAQIEAEEKAGVTPALQQLQLLASCYQKLKDDAGYRFALEKLLAYHPTKEYWNDAIYRVESRAGFSDRLRLDVLRLRDATGSLINAGQYSAMMQLSLNAGLPGEAKRIADRGFAAGLLGAGSDADLERKLRDTATKQAAEDEKLLAQGAASGAAAKDGTALFNVGFAYVNAGQVDKGLALMEQGMQKGGVQRPDDAKLHLAIAYLAAGQKAKAVAAFKDVGGTDGAADLAHLWLIQAQRSSS